MTKEKVEKKISELFDDMEKECVDADCIHCDRFFYPCGYLLLYRELFRWGFEEVWNSNQGNSYISFAPTHIFENEDGVVVEVWYSGWDVYYKKRGGKI
jgi:hypothetical protein